MKKQFLLMALLCAMLRLYAQNPFCGADTLLKYDSDANMYMDMLRENVKWWREHRQDTGYLPNGGGGQPGGSGKMEYLPGCRRAKIVIPVVVHILHHAADASPGTGSNISDAQVENMIEELNNYLANAQNSPYPARNTGIQVCLATKKPDGTSFNGILRKADTLTVHYFPSEISQVMQVDLFNPEEYLNIWVVDEIQDDVQDPGAATLRAAYAPFPYLQHKYGSGIVIRNKYAGNYTTCTGCNLDSDARGTILTHEMGHYLGVFHPFEGGCAGTSPSTCAFEGDLCCDVPPVAGVTYSCTPQNTCTETPDSADQKKNFMDYVPETCRNTFTANQVEIMYSTLYLLKPNLWGPTAANNKNMSCCYLSAAFSTPRSSACNSDTFEFTAIDYDTAEYRWKIYKGSTLIKDTTLTTFTYSHLLIDTGKYTVQLTVYSQGDSITQTRRDYVSIRACQSLATSTEANWYFGSQAGLNFTGGGPVADISITSIGLDPLLDAELGTITQSNAYGNLLFYAGAGAGKPRTAVYVYNKNFQPVSDSTLLGDNTSTSNILSVPNPANGAQYLIFCAGIYNFGNTTAGLRYSIFDTTLNGGLGNIVSGQKNIAVKAPSAKSYCLADSAVLTGGPVTAIPKCNNTDYWILTVEADTINYTESKILVYSLTSFGLTFHTRASYDVFSGTTAFDVSPDGRWLYTGTDIFSFDRSTGLVTKNYPDFFTSLNLAGCFSPNSEYFYTVERRFGTDYLIVQYDLYAQGIKASERSLLINLTTRQFNMQLGPDNKMYINYPGKSFLQVVENPDERLVNNNPNSIGYMEHGPDLKINGIGGVSQQGLPNMIDARKTTEIPFGIHYRQRSCDSVDFSMAKACPSTIKWYFGDGDSSTVAEPTHIYGQWGAYTVTLVVDGDTATRNIYIGIEPLNIAGDTVICDTSHIYSYSVPLTNYVYSWKTTNSSPSSTGDFTSFDVKWVATGQIKLIASEDRSGCVDSFTKTITIVPLLINNTISSSQFLCNNDTPALFTGTTPSGGTGTYTYSWLVSTDSVNWAPIAGATSSTYQALPQFRSKTYYVRNVTSGCLLASNVITITPTIQNHEIYPATGCIRGSSITINGATEPSRNYLWFYSYDSIAWFTDGTSTSSYSRTLDRDSMYFKRLMRTDDFTCEIYSNVIKVTPDIYVSNQPDDFYACEGWIFGFGLGMTNKNNQSLTYQWEYQNPGSGTWSNSFATKDFTSGGAALAYDGSLYRCKITTPCGDIYSDTAILYVGSGSPTIGTQPQSHSANEESTTLFTVAASSFSPVTYEWYYSYNNGISWIVMPGETNDTLIVPNVSLCQNKYQYKVKVANACEAVSGGTFSDAATLTVDTTRFADVWWRDDVLDDGTEPFYAPDQIWNSPDIWIRNDDDNGTTLQNPDYDTTYPNYVYYTIRNRGTDTSKPAELYLYWTKTGLGERWPVNWTANSNNMRINPCTGSIYYGIAYPMGGQINATAITIPAIAPGGHITQSYPWFPPNPYWYGTREKVFSFYVNVFPEYTDVCLLGRLVTCDKDSFGLARKEVENIKLNVYRNNNIVTRNVQLTNINRIHKRSTLWVGVRPPDGETPCTDIALPSVSGFSTAGEAIVHLDEKLLTAWELGGLAGSGFTMLDSAQLKVNAGQTFVLANVCLDTSDYAQIGVEYVWDSTYNFTEAEKYDFTLSQYTAGTSNKQGAVHMEVNFTMDGYVPPHVDSLQFVISPNPSNTPFVNVLIDANFAAAGEINIYDGFGSPMITPKSIYVNGSTSETVYVGGLSAGTYTMVITANGNNYNQLLVILNE